MSYVGACELVSKCLQFVLALLDLSSSMVFCLRIVNGFSYSSCYSGLVYYETSSADQTSSRKFGYVANMSTYRWFVCQYCSWLW